MPDASNFAVDSQPFGNERRSLPRPFGLPLPSTAPLTFKEREALRDLSRALRLTADRVDEALQTGRVDRGMDACTFAGELGIAAQRAAAVIGTGR